MQEWMQDFEKVGEALSKETTYVASLAHFMHDLLEVNYTVDPTDAMQCFQMNRKTSQEIIIYDNLC